MRKSVAKQIVENDAELNIKQLAEALLELGKQKVKPKRGDSFAGWRKLKIRAKEEELHRQKFARVWNKYRKS